MEFQQVYLRDIVVGADEEIVERFRGGFVHKFARDACCIERLYLKLISRKVRTRGTAKVVFTFTDLVDGPPDHSPGCCFYPWPFDFTSYVDADVPTKKRMILDALQQALLWIASKEGWKVQPFHDAYKEAIGIASKEGWKVQPFHDAYKEAIAAGLVFDGTSKKSWVSPCGKYRVRIYMRFDLEAVDFWAVLYRNRSSKELVRKFMGKGIPAPDCLHAYTSNGRWRSGTVFELRASTFIGEEWTVDFRDVIEGARGD
jgi:hypothetical protein